MKSAKQWAIEIAGKPEYHCVSIEGGSFDMLTSYPSLMHAIQSIQLDARNQALKDAAKLIFKLDYWTHDWTAARFQEEAYREIYAAIKE